jgi:hypothetical protein
MLSLQHMNLGGHNSVHNSDTIGYVAWEEMKGTKLEVFLSCVLRGCSNAP